VCWIRKVKCRAKVGDTSDEYRTEKVPQVKRTLTRNMEIRTM